MQCSSETVGSRLIHGSKAVIFRAVIFAALCTSQALRRPCDGMPSLDWPDSNARCDPCSKTFAPNKALTVSHGDADGSARQRCGPLDS